MIVVNARFLTQKLTGVQRFAFEMSCQLMELYHDDILFVAPRNIRRSRYSDQLKPVLIGKYTGYLWEQYELPRYLKKRGCPLLLNLCNLAPVVYRNKISTIHDITFVKYPADYPFRMRWMYKMLVPHILNTSIRIITVSHFSKNEISAYYQIPKDKIHVVYNAVNASFGPQRNERLLSERYIMAFASTGENKNFKMIMQSFIKVNEQYKDIKLYVIGECLREKEYDELRLHDSIVFMGRVSDEKLIELYSNAIAFVFPSLYEGFGIPVIEAQACGCPVIASNVTTFPEILGASALCIDPHKTDGFVDAILSLFRDIELRDKYIKLGYDNVTRFSWQKSGKELMRIMNSLS